MVSEEKTKSQIRNPRKCVGVVMMQGSAVTIRLSRAIVELMVIPKYYK